MESRREKRKRDWHLQLFAAQQQKQLNRQILQILRKDVVDRTEGDCRALLDNEEIVSELAAKLERRVQQRAVLQDRRKEKEDSPSTLRAKLDRLCDMVQEAGRHGGVVVHTGAGLSTSAGIPDFRGPKGVWTLGAKGQAVHMSLSYEEAQPTEAHMAIAELARRGIVRHVVTQNVDGLHTRSGVPLASLSELHGCVFKERCVSCGAKFLRPFDATQPQGSSYHRHRTGRHCGGPEPAVVVNSRATAGKEEQRGGKEDVGRIGQDEKEDDAGDPWEEGPVRPGMLKTERREAEGDEDKGQDGHTGDSGRGRSLRSPAVARRGSGKGEAGRDGGEPQTLSTKMEERRDRDGCGGALLDTIVHFGERIDVGELEAAKEASSAAGLALCLGTSLKVPPANKLPRLARRLAIVNLQWTAQDKSADLKINGRIEDVMRQLASLLDVAVPSYDVTRDPILCNREAPRRTERAGADEDSKATPVSEAQALVTPVKRKARGLRSRASFPRPLPG